MRSTRWCRSRSPIFSERFEINAQSDLPDATRTELLAQLEAALKRLDTEALHQARANELQATIDKSAQEVSRYQQLLKEVQANPPAAEQLVEREASTEQIDAQLALLQAERQALTERRSQLLKEIDDLPARRSAVQQRLADIQARIESNRSTLVTPAGTTEQRVAQLLAQARTQSWLAEQLSLQNEVLSESSRADMSSAERAWISQALEDTDLKLAALGKAAEKARASATRQEIEATEALRAELHSQNPELQAYAEQNRALAKQLQLTSRQNELARQDAQVMQTQLEAIEQDSHLMRRRLEVAGRKELLGRVMMTRLDSLPNTDQMKHEIRVRNNLIATTSLSHIDVDEEFRTVSARQQYIRKLVPDLDNWDAESRDLVARLVDQRQQLLENNLKDLGLLLRALVDNNETATGLINATDELHQFLIGNLMWVQNFSFLDLNTFYAQLAVFLSPRDWVMLPLSTVQGFQQHNWSAALVLLLLVVAVLRRRLRKPYEVLLSKPALLSVETMWGLLVGLVLSLLRILPWPLAGLIMGHFLSAVDPKTQFLNAMAPALMFTPQLLYIVLLTRLLLSRLGIGRRFLKWDARMLEIVRRELNWAGPLFVIAALVDIFAYHLDVVASGGPLGAIGTAILAGTIIVFSVRLLRQEIFAEDGRLKLALRLTTALGALVIFMQCLGLLFAAERYLAALCLSIVVVLAIKTVGDMMERWLLIQRARLERKAREELKALEEDGEEANADLEEQVDVVSLSEAHASLLSLGRLVTLALVLWLIWSPSLPAFNLLDSMTLWEVADSTDPESGLRAITVFDLAMGIFILVITALVAKHLPSLVQVLMLEWANISAGSRYASSILMQYVVIAVGGSMFLSTVGWEWSKLQWLVAALGVGIGFGLQEIVANFISGIIILFERPIRVGDIISAGGAEGTVKEISARATVLRTFEGKEHLIPNKELITGQVINWSLSENEVRVVIPVGIAYGSDVRKALALLLETAREVTQVLEEPEPRATFEDFGDNALVLWLRCYVADDRPGAWTELRTVINDKFNEAGIVIAFPQRDIHLDMMEPLRVQFENK